MPASVLSFLISASIPGLAFADGVSVVLRGSYIEQVSAGATVLDAHQLAAGASSGEVELADEGYAIGAVDDRNLATYFTRVNVGPVWDVDLVSWIDQGPGHDFFLFDVGGNDAIAVRPRFKDGTLGAQTVLKGWTPTGYTPVTGPNAGQEVYGVAFAAHQLVDVGSLRVGQGIELIGLRFESTRIDGAAFLVHRPDPTAGVDGDGQVTVEGSTRAGQLVELVYDGPWASETDLSPNPFLDYRLSVELRGPDGFVREIPGFFDADGAGGEWGTVWKARFRPHVEGTWLARAHFVTGPDVAIDPDDAGAAGMLDGVGVIFDVGPIDPGAPGFLRWGTLRYADEHYLRFDEGPWFIEAGTNSPENFLAYRGFDGVTKAPWSVGVLHSYAPHVIDWQPGDPHFRSRDHGVDSKGIIGALNYLSEQGLNSIYALALNLGGDGWDAHPFLGSALTDFDRTHYDTGRLAQWHTVFEHAAARGLMINMVLAETELQNEQWLDGGAFGPQRKLFLRELVARFGASPALSWIICEENDFSLTALRDIADWIRSLDPGCHPVTFHNHFHDWSDYDVVLGEQRFETTAFQYGPDQGEKWVEKYRGLSDAAGHRWNVVLSEHGPADEGLSDDNQDLMRKRILYDALFSGGHVQWYAGWHDLPLGGDLTLEDLRTRESTWKATGAAVQLLSSFPFVDMEPQDGLLLGEAQVHGGGEVFALTGEVYLVYMPQADSAARLDLTATTGEFLQRWFDPREGAWISETDRVLKGGTYVPLGKPPYAPGEDWVCVVERKPKSGL